MVAYNVYTGKTVRTCDGLSSFYFTQLINGVDLLFNRRLLELNGINILK